MAVFSNKMLIERSKVFRENITMLPEGCRVIFYTDGLTEARNEKDPYNDFESTGLLPALMKATSSNLSEFIEEIFRELISFKGNEIFEDDVCIICMDVA